MRTRARKPECNQPWRNDGHIHHYIINAGGAGWVCEWPHRTDARLAEQMPDVPPGMTQSEMLQFEEPWS